MRLPLLRRALTELPLLAGVAVGLGLYWWLGFAFVLDGTVEGYHWADYFENAWMIVNRVDLGYASFRYPLHAALVGHLGEALDSYANAAILVSSVGAFAMVLGNGLLGRVLAGPWAGGVAALLVPTAQVALTAGRWGNLYTALAGASLLTLGLAAVVARRPRWGLAALAGLVGGVAWGLDPRGLAMVPAAAALVLHGASRIEPGAARRLRQGGLLAAFLLPLTLGPISREALWLPTRGKPTLEHQIQTQRAVFLRWASNGHHDTAMPAACRDEDPTVPLHPGLLWTPCAQEMLKFNLTRAIPSHTPVPAPLLWVGLPLCLVPRRERVRDDLAQAAAALGLGAAALVGLLLWMPFPDRYLLQFAPLFALIPAVGLARATHRLSPKALAPYTVPVVMVGLAAAAWTLDTTERRKPTTTRASPEVRRNDQVAAALAARLEPGEAVLDCADLHTPARWLPRLTSTPPMWRLDDDYCLRWLRDPQGEGRAWVILDRDRTLQASAGGEIQTAELLEPWELSHTVQDISLYVRDVTGRPPLGVGPGAGAPVDYGRHQRPSHQPHRPTASPPPPAEP